MLVVINGQTRQLKHFFYNKTYNANQPDTPFVIILWSPTGRHTSCNTIYFHPQRDASNHVREWNFLLTIVLKLTSDHKFREGLDADQVCSRDTFVSATVIVLHMLDCEFSIFKHTIFVSAS